MPKECFKCGDDCVPADDFDCDRHDSQFICPTCAPDFVLANATSFTDVEDPLV